MSRPTLGNILFESVRLLVIAVIKIILVAIAWTCKIIGMVLSKIGETIEKQIIRQS